jgi:hypothetical protein
LKAEAISIAAIAGIAVREALLLTPRLFLNIVARRCSVGAEVDADTKELLIFVHGTGASDVADAGSNWWQLGSNFSNEVCQQLGPGAEIAPPFHWSGANSELVRQKAGRALLERLRQIDESGRGYHLVGHSHGGSIIWLALIESAAQGKQLVNLRSWCTVGTPFLTFAPRWPDFWRCFAALFVTVVFSALLYFSNIGELPGVLHEIWNDDVKWPLIGYLGLLFVAALLWIWAVARALIPIAVSAIFRVRAGIPVLAAKWYGDNWLSLWHPLDEPINSLSGTLGPAPRIAPRRGESALFRFIPFLGLIWDKVLMRAADEFAWRQVTDRAQGADLANRVMVDVGRAPQPLAPGFGPLAPQIVDELTASANTHSLALVAKVRALLEDGYSQRNTETIMDRVGAVMTFQELIHTTYFDNPAVATSIAAHIRSPSTTGIHGSSPAVLPPTEYAEHRARITLPTRGALEFVSALAIFILPALGFWLSITTVTQAVVVPYTLGYQLESAKTYATQMRIMAAGNGSKLASLLLGFEKKGLVLGFEKKGLVADPVTFIESIPQSLHKRQAAVRLAYAYGRLGRINDVQRLLDRNEPADIQAEYQARIRLLAFIGNATLHSPAAQGAAPASGGQSNYDPAFLQLIDYYLDHLSETTRLSADVRAQLTGVALMQMGLSEQTDRAQKWLDFITAAADQASNPASVTCGPAQAFATGRAVASPATDVRSLLKLCGDDAVGIMRQVALQVLSSRNLDGLSAFAVANAYQGLSPDQIEDFLFTAKDQDDLIAKIKLIKADIALLERAFPAEQLAQFSREDSWASRLARNYLAPIALLSELVRGHGATHLADALLDVVVRQSAKSDEPMEDYLGAYVQALVAAGRGDDARQAFSKYQDAVKSRPQQSGDDRIQTLRLLTILASAVGDKDAVQGFGDEVLAMKVGEASTASSLLISGIAESVLPLDQIKARGLLLKALDYSALEADDLTRNATTNLLLHDITKAGAVRQARIAATQIGNTDLALDGLLNVVTYLDPSGSYDFEELGSLSDMVKKVCEKDGNPLDKNPF